MRNRTFKKIGGSFKWLRSRDINNTLKSIKMDIDSRCNRKFLKFNKICESRGYNQGIDFNSSIINPYSSINEALVRENTGKCFYYISPEKRKFIFKINHSQINKQYLFATKFMTNNEKFNYVFFTNINTTNNTLSDYDANIKDPDFIISCNMFGLISADVIDKWKKSNIARFFLITTTTTPLNREFIPINK